MIGSRPGICAGGGRPRTHHPDHPAVEVGPQVVVDPLVDGEFPLGGRVPALIGGDRPQVDRVRQVGDPGLAELLGREDDPVLEARDHGGEVDRVGHLRVVDDRAAEAIGEALVKELDRLGAASVHRLDGDLRRQLVAPEPAGVGQGDIPLDVHARRRPVDDALHADEGERVRGVG